jgi:hypothetical protein
MAETGNIVVAVVATNDQLPNLREMAGKKDHHLHVRVLDCELMVECSSSLKLDVEGRSFLTSTTFTTLGYLEVVKSSLEEQKSEWRDSRCWS